VDWDTTISLSNRFVNWSLKKIKEPYSFRKKIKAKKKAVKHISDFEETATELAIEKTTTM
jgi:hypothetical protein